MLPNSLTKVLSFALGFSPHLPVSVCGTGGTELKLRGFSWQPGLMTYALRPLTFQDQGTDLPIPLISLCALHRNYQQSGSSTKLRHPIALNVGHGMLTVCPSSTHLCLDLGPTNPTRTDLASETLDIRRSWFSHDLRYSCRHSHFCSLHRSLQYGFDAHRTLPY